MLGKVLHSTKSGYIVVELRDPKRIPRLGVPVYTSDRRRIGVLLDIIGPVERPYAVVKPDKDEYIKAVEEGQNLYYEVPRPPRRRERRRRRGGPLKRGGKGARS